MRPTALLLVLAALSAMPYLDDRAGVLPLPLGAVVSAAGAAQAPPPQWADVPLVPHLFREYPEGYRQDTIEISIPPSRGIEYKLGMEAGDTIVYTWHVPAGMKQPELLTSEFHGHTEPPPGEPGAVMFYRVAKGDRESGALVAPFDGIHGWYLLNETELPILVELTVAGFYEVIAQ